MKLTASCRGQGGKGRGVENSSGMGGNGHGLWQLLGYALEVHDTKAFLSNRTLQ